MSDAKRSAGYFGLNSEWAGRVAPPHSEYLISFNNSDCLFEYWKPRAEDTQEPHDRDEVFVLVAGQSDFSLGDKQRSVKTGDLIFVPAGTPHKFFNFTDDLAMCIVFFGKRHEGFDPIP